MMAKLYSLKGSKHRHYNKERKKGYVNFITFLVIRLLNVTFFRNLVQNSLKGERLKFAEKHKPRAKDDSDPKTEETLFFKHMEVMMVDVTEGLDTKVDEVNMLNSIE